MNSYMSTNQASNANAYAMIHIYQNDDEINNSYGQNESKYAIKINFVFTFKIIKISRVIHYL